MVIKFIQWNIGGGMIRKPQSDPIHELVYTEDGFDYLCSIFKKYQPDIIFLQETHRKTAQRLSSALELSYFVNDVYASSHIVKGEDLGQAIISKYKLDNHKFTFYINPKLVAFRPTLIHPEGEKWVSHDRGVAVCNILIGGKIIEVKTTHLIPFQKFGANPLDDKFVELRNDICNKIKPDSEYFLLAGDFNYNENSLKKYLPDLFSNGVSELIVDRATTPKGKYYDHILFKNLQLLKYEVISSALTDHFPIYCEMEL